MIFQELKLSGLYLVLPEPRVDPRGHFARTYCAEEFAQHGLPNAFLQCNVSFNAHRGTLRGLHWQADPYQEGKLVRCARGAIFDVAVDLRPGSPTYGKWASAELTAANAHALYIPPGFAHGFQSLEDASEVFYQMTTAYRDGYARGMRWNDPALAITWPIADPILSDRDAALPTLT